MPGRRTRRPAALAALVAAALLTACGGGATSAPPTTATTTTTAPVFVATTAPRTPAGAQLTWLLGVLGGPLPAATLDAHFDAHFLAAVPTGVLAVDLTQVAPSRPVRLVGILPLPGVTPTAPDQLAAVVAIGKVRDEVELSTDGSGEISGLRIGPYLGAVPDSWGAVDRQLAAVAPRTSLLVARVTGGGCQAVHAVDAGTPRPTGSMFKLFVLGAVARAVGAGTLRWDQDLTVEDAWKSLPSGTLQDSPAGTRISVRDTATQMISISDNTAADLLIHTVGRPAVEAQVRAWAADPALDEPFLTTRELFVLKGTRYPTLADRYAALPRSARAGFLATDVDPLPLAPVTDWVAPRSIDTVEWFASPDDLCRAFAGLHQLAARPGLSPIGGVLSANTGGIGLDPGTWPTVWFKGGSEPGVLTLGYLATDVRGRTWVVVAMASDPAAPLATTATSRLLTVVKGALGVVG